ncbi:HAMP domain-containing sensor histidine kinase [Litoribacillus peritrichatus]|uniref:histidine kinase n=1 Tax=Litoribacillus peritrichatus TaxID=718191 RepID=A0ABP7N3R0_9GAMM
MKSLFTKIFLSFWLMIILVIITTAFLLYQSRLQSHELPLPLERASFKAERAYEVRGELGLQRWLQHTRGRLRPHNVFLLKDHKGLFDDDVPKSVRRVSKKLSEEVSSIQVPTGGHLYFGRYFKTDDNKEFTIIYQRPPIHKAFLAHMANTGWALFASLTLMSGIICYLLARHLTLPVRALQDATQSLAQGDLDVEITPRLGKRKDELSELARDFDEMAKQIKNAYNSQRRLVHDMSHELRAPIARMQVALAIMEGADKHDTQMIQRMQHEVDHFESIIKQTLSLPAFELSTIELSDKVDVRDTLLTLISDFKFEHQNSQLNIQLNQGCLINQPLWVQSKDNWISTIFRNVISNAVQYRLPDTAITICTSQKTFKGLTIHRVEITNESLGVDNLHLEEIFEPFSRADQARTPGSTNIGLGLSIVKALVKLHDGKVFAENIQDQHGQIKAFKVTIELPAAKNS